MMQTPGTPRDEAYDALSIAFHWVTVFLVLAVFLLTLVPGIVKGSIELHKSLGLAVLTLVPLRILWRLFRGRTPPPEADVPLLLRIGAKAAHLALYALLVAVPVLGALYVTTKGLDLHYLGMEVPPVFYYDRELAMTIYGWKKVIAYGLLALIGLHAAAAIVYHSAMRKDGVLRSMLPRRLRGGAIA